ncbi:unnamed protein product, partial [Mesorhabditis belari]|uniref:Uncharacterized protein n=1 Tax=Mesorhabditis belari TaxID=2138241 RepID=A0AAF3FJU0_9BILA
MIQRIIDKFTKCAWELELKINTWSLLNIPQERWRLFTALVYIHFLLATFLFVFGIICFCLGMQFSVMYEEVNCSDGTNIFMPLLNLIASFTGLFTLRTLHLHWPAFIHFVSLWVVLPINIVQSADSAAAASRWFHYAKDPRSPSEWAHNYAYMDIFLAFMGLLNDVVCVGILWILLKYWCQESVVQNSPRSTRQPLR